MDENYFFTNSSDKSKDNMHTDGPGIDLNEHLVRNKPATFFMRVNCDTMTHEGIYKGDVVIVDRSLEPKNGKIVIANVGGEFLIRKLEITEGRRKLVASKKVAAIDISHQPLNVWGTVTYVIHNL